MGDWKPLLIGLAVRLLLAWLTKRCISKSTARVGKVKKQSVKAKLRKRVVDMLPAMVGWVGSVLARHVFNVVSGEAPRPLPRITGAITADI